MVALLFTSALSFFAVLPSDFIRILIPVVAPDPIPGAAGSRWTTELWAANLASRFISLSQTPAAGDCELAACEEKLLSARSEREVYLYSPFWGGGAFVYVERAGAKDVYLHLLTQDVNHSTEEAGVEIPLVRTEDIRPGSELALVGITLTDDYRLRVRIFDLDGRRSRVAMRVVDSASGALLHERELVLDIREQTSAEFPTHPGYAAVDLTREQIPLDARIRIEIGPYEAARIWAMATLTNNHTQRVTLFSPQPSPLN